MAEHIEREAVLRSRQWGRLILDFDREAARGIIASIPAADVAPVVHGEWETGYPITCSVCGGYAATEYEDANIYEAWLSPYCPNCGADMRERKGDDELSRTDKF